MWFLSILLLLWLVLPGQAAIRYVNINGGNDSNSCNAMTNALTPRQHISAGIACLQSGDTLMIKSGTYVEVIPGHLIPSGTPSAYTTIRAETPRGVILRPTDAETGAYEHRQILYLGDPVRVSSQAYITLAGLVFDLIDSPHGWGVNTSWQIPSHDYLFDNIEVRNVWMLNDNNAGNSGIGWSSPNIIMRNSSVHDIGLGSENNSTFWAYGIYGVSSGSLVENNEFYNITGYTIHQYSSGGIFENVTIRNNFFHDGGTVLLNCGNGSGNPNAFYNNILLRMASTPAGDRHNIKVCYDNTAVYNNTIVQGGKPGDSGHPQACINLQRASTARNNLCYGNVDNRIYSEFGGATLDHNQTDGTNPRFANASGTLALPTDFQLSASSPAPPLDAGVSTASGFPTITTDYGGQARQHGSAQDLGAWEFGGGTLIEPTHLPLLYWPLDEGTGTTASDATGNNHTLSWTSPPGPSWATGKAGRGALACDGSTSVATMPEDLATPQYTWMLWFQGTAAPSLTTDQAVFAKATQFGFLWGANDACCRQALSHRDGAGNYINAVIPGPLVGGRWYHLTGSYDGNLVRIYRDGQPVASAIATSLWGTGGGITVCSSAFAPVAGMVDEIRLWNRPLTDAEILAEYNKQKQAARHTGNVMK